MKTKSILKIEKMYYLSHLSEWLKYYPGMYVLIKGDQFCGIYVKMEDALAEGIRLFGKDSFLVRKIESAIASSLPAILDGKSLIRLAVTS